MSAVGFVPAKITFRDRAPAEDVTLDPLRSPPKAVKTPTGAPR